MDAFSILAITIDVRIFLFLFLILLWCIHRLHLCTTDSVHGMSMRNLIKDVWSQVATTRCATRCCVAVVQSSGTTKAPSCRIIVWLDVTLLVYLWYMWHFPGDNNLPGKPLLLIQHNYHLCLTLTNLLLLFNLHVVSAIIGKWFRPSIDAASIE